MPHGARWAVRGLDYDRTTQVALVWMNKARSGASIYGISPEQFKEGTIDGGYLRFRVMQTVLHSFWRTLGAA